MMWWAVVFSSVGLLMKNRQHLVMIFIGLKFTEFLILYIVYTFYWGVQSP